MITLFLLAASLQQETIKEMQNHLIIHDEDSALRSANSAYRSFPEDSQVLASVIKAMAQTGDEAGMLRAYKSWLKTDQQDKQEKKKLIEEMSWGVIKKGSKSSKPMIRVLSTLAAYFCQDARGIDVIRTSLRDSNPLIRGITAELSQALLDEPIRQEILRLVTEEKESDVRLQAIRALGTMKIHEAKPFLENLIQQEGINWEEKASAMEALVALTESSPRYEVERLSRSENSSMRELSALVIIHFQEKRDQDILLNLVDDPKAEVRMKAWQGLALLGTKTDKSGLHEADFNVQLISAYHQLLTGGTEVQKWVENVFKSGSKDEKRKAAALLRSSGERGIQLAKKHFNDTDEFFARINLALALLDQNSLDILYTGLINHKEKWMEDEIGPLKMVTESKITHQSAIPNYPEIINKEIRLTILNTLAIKEYPRALDAAKSFLKDKDWGISGFSSAMLLTEGDDTAIELIRPLLKDPDPQIRLQAALILAKWDPQEDVAHVLIENYPRLTKEKKEIVLEALGEIEDPKGIDFLVGELSSPHQSMRIIAAASILKCLYD